MSKTRIQFDLDTETNNELNQLAFSTGETKSSLLRKGIKLVKLTLQPKEGFVGIFDKENNLIKRILI